MCFHESPVRKGRQQDWTEGASAHPLAGSSELGVPFREISNQPKDFVSVTGYKGLPASALGKGPQALMK